MGLQTMSECVRRHHPRSSDPDQMPAQKTRDTPRGQSGSAKIHKERALRCQILPIRKRILKRPSRRRAERYRSLLRTLTHDFDPSVREVDVAKIEAHRFA